MSRIKPPALSPEVERRLASGLYNDVWRLMELPDRTPEQSDAMLHAAHASRHHWAAVGGPVNLARGEWLCARVYSVLGRAEPAVWHARRCLELAMESEGREDWDVPGAQEALARAYLTAGNRDEARRWAKLGLASVAAVANREDREPIEKDLRELERELA